MSNSQKKATRPKARLVVFAYGGVHPLTVQCLLREIRLWPELQFEVTLQDALLVRSRSTAASDFLKAPQREAGDVLLMVDNDIAWREGDFLYLAKKVLETCGVVGGPYPMRDWNKGITAHADEPGTYMYGDDILVGAKYVATGFIGIHRRVLEKMRDALPLTTDEYWPFFRAELMENDKQPDRVDFKGEDVLFCERAAEAGFSVHLAMRPVIVHVGDHTFRVIDGQTTPEPPTTKVQLRVPRQVEDPVFDTLVQDIAAFLNLPLNQMRSELHQSTTKLAQMWSPARTVAEETQWYQREDVGHYYILDNSAHNLLQAELIDNSLGQTQGQRVLDFGAGVGTMALFLAKRGNEVWCVEINPLQRKFIDFRAKQLGVMVNWLQQGEETRNQFDLVICWHTFEHLSYPLPALMQLTAALRVGGRMFTQSAFGATASHPMHHGQPNWERVLRSYGLVPIKGQPHMYERLKEPDLGQTAYGFEMYLPPHDMFIAPSIRLNGTWEPDAAKALMALLRLKDTFVDLGAHIGFFSLLAATRCAKVIAVEPIPAVADMLEQNVRLNSYDNVEVVRAAVWERLGGAILQTDPLNTGANYISNRGEIEAPSLTLERLFQQHGTPRVMKIDIEGAEYLVLKAADPSAFTKVECLIVEYAPENLERVSGCSGEEYLELLETLGYTLYSTLLWKPMSAGQVAQAIQAPSYANLLALRT